MERCGAPHATTCVMLQTSCPGQVRGKPCKGTRFRALEDTVQCVDYQEIKVQEQVQSLSVGSIPRSIVVVMQYDLVDSCKV